MLPNPHSVLIGLEAETSSIRAYQAQLVPGLLQTEDYMRAILRAGLMVASHRDETDRFVEVRKARQALLAQEPAVMLWAVLDEAVLRRRIGSADVMRGQLDRLMEVPELPNVSVQVLPTTRASIPGLKARS